MPNREDYYEILDVPPDASQEDIQKAYIEWAQIYHPDRYSNQKPSVRNRAQEEMKKINQAYEVLGDPEKRKKYHSEWLRNRGATTVPPGTYKIPKPKPVVEPPCIRFDNVPAKTVKTSSFIVRNNGGPYSEIWISDPKSWVKITNYMSLSDSDELPLRIELAVEGDDWGTKYLETIIIRLDNEETHLKIELRTQDKPIKQTTYVSNFSQRSYSSSPYQFVSSSKTKMSIIISTGAAICIAAAVIFGIGYLFVEGYNKLNNWVDRQNAKLNAPPPTLVIGGERFPKKNLVAAQDWGRGLHVWERRNNRSKNLEVHLEWSARKHDDFEDVREGLLNLGQMIKDGSGYPAINNYAKVGDKIWAVGRYAGLDCGGGFICHSPDKGETWFSQWVTQPTYNRGDPYDVPFEIRFLNEREGFAVTKRRITVTSNGGMSWKDAFYSPMGSFGAVYDLTTEKNKGNFIVEDEGGLDSFFLMRYRQGLYPGITEKSLSHTALLVTSDGGRKWYHIPEGDPKFPQLKKIIGWRKNYERMMLEKNKSKEGVK